MRCRLVVIPSCGGGHHQFMMGMADGFRRCTIEIDDGQETPTCLGKVASKASENTEALPCATGELGDVVLGAKTLDLRIVSRRGRGLSEMSRKSGLMSDDAAA